MDTFAEMNAKIGRFDFKLAWSRRLILRVFRSEDSTYVRAITGNETASKMSVMCDFKEAHIRKNIEVGAIENQICFKNQLQGTGN